MRDETVTLAPERGPVEVDDLDDAELFFRESALCAGWPPEHSQLIPRAPVAVGVSATEPTKMEIAAELYRHNHARIDGVTDALSAIAPGLTAWGVTCVLASGAPEMVVGGLLSVLAGSIGYTTSRVTRWTMREWRAARNRLGG